MTDSEEALEVRPTRQDATSAAPGEPASEVYLASQWRLMWWKFRKHPLAMASAVFLIGMYLVAAFCEFLAPHTPGYRNGSYASAPPQRIHFFSDDGVHVRPFVYVLRGRRHRRWIDRRYCHTALPVTVPRVTRPAAS